MWHIARNIYTSDQARTLSFDRAPCDAVGDVFKPRVHIQHFGRRRLSEVRSSTPWRLEVGAADLAVATALEERCHADKADIVVPHHGILCVIPRNLEVVMKNWFC